LKSEFQFRYDIDSKNISKVHRQLRLKAELSAMASGGPCDVC